MNSLSKPIGDRPLSLAAHLRRVANLVSSNAIPYNWGHCSQCNCGLLARSILGVSRNELNDLLTSIHGLTWTAMAKSTSEACAFNPNVSMPTIFKQLQCAGLLLTDLHHLEHLSHDELRGWIFRRDKRNAANFVRYCKRWAAAIESYRAAYAEPVGGQPVVQSAPVAPSDAELEQIETRALVS